MTDNDQPRAGPDHHINFNDALACCQGDFFFVSGIGAIDGLRTKNSGRIFENLSSVIRDARNPRNDPRWDNAEGRFAASVPLGMRRSVMDRERPDH
jgi:hypothetical protein